MHGDAGRSEAEHDDAQGLDRLADDLQRVEERRHDHDRGAVLVVVEDGDVELVLSRSSISKQRGAEMSSRLMPPKVGAISFTV